VCVCVCVAKAYLQESIANANTTQYATLDNSAVDVESFADDHVTGTGRDDIEAALSGRIALTNSALQVSNSDYIRLYVYSQEAAGAVLVLFCAVSVRSSTKTTR